jgi:hypothetical protein
LNRQYGLPQNPDRLFHLASSRNVLR